MTFTAGSTYTKRERPELAKRTVDRRAADGVVLGSVDLDPEWFGVPVNVALMHQVVVSQLAAIRAGTQSTKTRAEVAGGGAKPFRQKGMGRSRQGSIRSPQWVGGGVALGPKPRSYKQHTPKKMIRGALLSALSDRAALGRVVLVGQWVFEIPKTKQAVTALKDLGLEGRILVVLGPDDVVAERSFGNIQRVQTLQADELNTYDILRNDWIVFTDDSIPGGVGDVSSHKRPEPAAKADTEVVEEDAVVGEDAEDDADAEDETEGAKSPTGADATGADTVTDEALTDEADEASSDDESSDEEGEEDE